MYENDKSFVKRIKSNRENSEKLKIIKTNLKMN